ncbi:unnamed protein product [Prorocentrum cordatum]|uniref:DNA-directed RNA polymerase n=1 Tax=Prorocentrum cordatum TaxID=2364126 RepID=A0ABN9UE14_9DINO|nr:unnamed protein product [Polarella glacialis]
MTRSGSIAAKGDVLGTVDLAVPKTADIVQGLPKINSMFEVAKQATNIEGRLDELWEDAKKQYRGVEAAKMAIRALQMELPAEIQSVYREQGVSINAKHIELVVRQMTNKCLVVQGAGLLKPGSLVSYLDVEAAQALMTSDSIVVRPVVRGITRVGMDNHVLVGMGFREVDNVLLADLVGGPALHPLSGIKENLMIGKAISAGTNAST